jgi:plastocyanin
MKTRSALPVSMTVLSLLLVSCSAAATPFPTPTPAPPTQEPSVTMPPMNPPTEGLNPAETLPPAATNTPAPGGTGTVDITIQNFAFNPPSVTIKVGTTVRWTNLDSVTHSVASDTGLWDSGGIAQGESYTRVFDTAGTFGYYCGIHPTMKGAILVAP